MKFPVRVSCVSYLNSKPFIYGLKNHIVYDQIELSTDNPAECALKLINNNVDIGLVPVAALPIIENSTIISDYCISADNDVKSVLLLSEVPLDQIKTIVLDYQSLTSVNLVQILASFHWKIHPEFINAKPGYEQNIKGSNAAVVIGDRALELINRFPFAFDLAGEWKKFTGLPFVFACWVSNKKLNSDFVAVFNDALKKGVESIDDVIADLKFHNDYFTDIENYLKKNLNFLLDDSKRQALQLFLEYIKKMNPVAAHS